MQLLLSSLFSSSVKEPSSLFFNQKIDTLPASGQFQLGETVGEFGGRVEFVFIGQLDRREFAQMTAFVVGASSAPANQLSLYGGSSCTVSIRSCSSPTPGRLTPASFSISSLSPAAGG